MRKRLVKAVALVLMAVLLFCVPGLVGCGEEEEEEKVTIRLGYVTDLSGAASSALKPIAQNLEDMVRYINEGDLIPEVEIRVVTYDTHFDPARDIPGYEWCKERGAKVVLSVLPQTGEALKPLAETDKVPIASISGTKPIVEPPGWVFVFSSSGPLLIETLLEWVSEQWDYAGTGRKPKIGSAMSDYPYDRDLTRAIKEYCQTYPDKFEYVAGLLAPLGTMMWSGEADRLKGCDYVCPPGIATDMAAFVKRFRDKDYAATFIGTDSHSAFKGFQVDACGWGYLDGMLTIHGGTRWWGEQVSLVELCEELLYKYRSQEAESTIYSGIGYIGSSQQHCLFFDILKKAIEEVGAENFDGQAFYNTAIEFKTTYEGYPESGFTETVRYAFKHGSIYEWRAEVSDLVRIGDWVPLITE